MTWLLIDGNNLAKRCKHSQAYLTTTQGKTSGTISGFMLGLMHAANHARVTKREVIVVWDGGRAKWREELYPEYKKNRKKDDPDDPEYLGYIRQVIDIQTLLDSAGVRQIRLKGEEADDVIAQLAVYIFNRDEIVIYSTDDDFLQFYETAGRIKIHNPGKKEYKRKFVDDAYMLKKFNFPEGKFVALYKSIVGDSSDNIKGVDRIGPKRINQALPFLRVTSEGVFVDSAEQDGSNAVDYARRIQTNQDIVLRNLKLIDLKRGIRSELVASVMECLREPLSMDMEEAQRIFRDYELVDIGSRFMEW